jgi:hypothetical protein
MSTGCKVTKIHVAGERLKMPDALPPSTTSIHAASAPAPKRTVTPLGHVTSAAHPARAGPTGGSMTSRKFALRVRRGFL